MKVSSAKINIENINKLIEQFEEFDSKHQNLFHEIAFMMDATNYLIDYRGVLERAIENAELNI